MKGWSKSAWTGALLLSLLLHAGAAALLASRQDDVQIAGGNPVDIAVLGNSFEDAVSTGEVSEIHEPEAVAADRPPDAERLAAENVQAPAAEAVRPVDEASVEPVPTPTAEASALAEPSVPEVQGTIAVPSVERPRPEEPEAVTRPEAAEPAEAEAARRAEIPPAELNDTERAEAVEPEETINPVADAPIPLPRPDIEALKAEEARREAERREEARRRQAARHQEAPRQQRPRATAGAGGASQADARRGDAAGAAEGRSAQSSGQGSQASAASNAAVSNYPGQVVSRLRRSLSYPAPARRQRITGEVHVAFTIAGSGAVSGVRVVRSSGHSVLDEAAVQTVRRAAPFPAIPSEAGRSNWDFTVPLAFSR